MCAWQVEGEQASGSSSKIGSTSGGSSKAGKNESQSQKANEDLDDDDDSDEDDEDEWQDLRSVCSSILLEFYTTLSVVQNEAGHLELL